MIFKFKPMKRFWIKLTHYEYWPMWAFYLPLFPYFLYRGIVNGHLFHFTNVNHNLDTFRGLFFDSKKAIDRKIPQAYRPRELAIHPAQFKAEMLSGWAYPIIIKPDKGERGKGVLKVADSLSLDESIGLYDEDIIIQEFVDYPLEFGVFVALNPENLKYRILSITKKHYFEVTGDGHSTLEQLILATDRGVVFKNELFQVSGLKPEIIVPKGEHLTVHTQGNHCKGTRFENANYLINSANQKMFGQFLKGLDGFEYGRFDVKCKSESDLETFQNFKVIEFNGISAEATIVYDASVGYFKSLKIFKQHWKCLEEIARFNQSRGFKPLSFNAVLKRILKH